GVSLLLTGASAYFVATAAAARDRGRFGNAVERTQTAIQRRIETYVNLLRGGAGLFAAENKVTRAQFKAYVDRLDLQKNYPGIQGVGISARLLPQMKDELIKRLRAEGMTDFKIHPDTARVEYHAIIYLEPPDARNDAA